MLKPKYPFPHAVLFLSTASTIGTSAATVQPMIDKYLGEGVGRGEGVGGGREVEGCGWSGMGLGDLYTHRVKDET